MLFSEHLKEASENKYIIENARYGEKYVISVCIPIQTTINYLTKFCLEQIEKLNVENKYFYNLRDLLRTSHVVPYNLLIGIELFNEDKNR